MAERKPKSGRSKTSPEEILRTKQEIEALDMRMSGQKLQKIADKHKVTVSCVSRRIQKCLKEAAQERLELGEEMLDLELMRIDSILLAMWPKIEKGHSARHAEVALKAIAQRDKLLGLEAPQQLDVTMVPKDEARRRIAEAIARRREAADAAARADS